jgi:hypothetical protein
MRKFLFTTFTMLSIMDGFSQELLKDDINDMTSGSIQIYSTKYHEKSNGLNIELTVPKSWLRKEGVRPHMLSVFSSGQSNKEYSFGCTIGISDEMPDTDISNQDLSGFMLQETISKLETESKVLFAKTTKYDGEYGYIIGYQVITDRAGVSVLMINISHYIIYKNRVATVSCYYGVLQSISDITATKECIKDFVTLSLLIGNSIVIKDKWQ